MNVFFSIPPTKTVTQFQEMVSSLPVVGLVKLTSDIYDIYIATIGSAVVINGRIEAVVLMALC